MAAYTDSGPEVTELDLRGVWLHFPGGDPADSSRSYPYGASQRGDALDIMGEANYYAGRADPVVDYGEHQEVVIQVTVDVPHGADYRASLTDLTYFAESRQTVHYRDNRGRAAYGQMEGFSRKDMDWGTQVSFTILQSAWDRETVS